MIILSLIKFIDPPEEIFTPEPTYQKSTVTVKVDCVVNVNGVACKASAGEVNIISPNEPTEPLKNMNTAIHSRFVPSAPMLYHDPKYGVGMIPTSSVSNPKRRRRSMSIIKGRQADWGVIAPQGLLLVLLLRRYFFALVAGLVKASKSNLPEVQRRKTVARRLGAFEDIQSYFRNHVGILLVFFLLQMGVNPR